MKKEKKLTQNDVLKYEIAAELGLLEKVDEVGWRGLSARESGKIGGILAKRRRDFAKAGYDIDEMAIDEFRFEDSD